MTYMLTVFTSIHKLSGNDPEAVRVVALKLNLYT